MHSPVSQELQNTARAARHWGWSVITLIITLRRMERKDFEWNNRIFDESTVVVLF